MVNVAARVAAFGTETRALAREALSDRRTQLFAGAAGIALLVYLLGSAVAGGDLKRVALLLGLVAFPYLALLALNRPYVFPYGLYVLLVPFDNMLAIGGGGTLTKLVGILSTIALVVWIFRKRTLLRPPAVVVVAGAYVFWVLLSSLWAVDQQIAFTDVQTTFSLVVLYAVLSVAPIDERGVRGICRAVIAGGTGAAIFAIAYFHNAPLNEEGRLMMVVGGHPIDPNGFADSLLLPIALALVGLLHARKAPAVLAALAALAIMGEAVIITLSREAMLAWIGMAVVIVLMSRRRLLALAIAVPTLALLPLLVPSVMRRILEAGVTGGAGRTSIWAVDLHAWAAHPIIGWGAGSAFQAYSIHLLRVAPRLFPGWDRPPHNVPLHTLVDYGLVGLALTAAGYFGTFLLLRRIGRDDPLYDLRVALTAGLAALGIASFFIDLGSEKYVWLALATAVQLVVVARTRQLPAQAATVVYEPPPAAKITRRLAR